jgi:hypothetical protein
MTHGLSGRLRSALPDVVVDAPDEERDRRDRVVDATMYLVAFAISTATLVDTWELHPPWLRPVAVVAVIATVVALRWRRTHPGAVGIGVAAVSVPLTTAPFVALFNAAIRARGRDLAVAAGLTIVSCFTNPLLYRGPQSLQLEFGAGLGIAGAALGWGLFVRARRQLVRSMRRAGRPRRGRGARGRAATDRARDARRARPPPLAALRPRRRARVQPR